MVSWRALIKFSTAVCTSLYCSALTANLANFAAWSLSVMLMLVFGVRLPRWFPTLEGYVAAAVGCCGAGAAGWVYGAAGWVYVG